MKDFILYAEALALKELGFDEPCFGRWLVITKWEKPTGEVRLQIGFNAETWDKNQCFAPTYAQAFRFFREKYELFYSIERESAQEYLCNYSIKEFDGIKNIDHRGNGYRYEEEAELACLRKLIEVVKNKSI